MNRMLSVLALAATAGAALAADWPQWRGPDRNGIGKDTGLLKEWPADGPPLKWKAENIGTGYSSPIIVAGRIYIQTTRNNEEFCLALDEKSGKEVWSSPIGKIGKNRGPQYPGTRATPTFDDGRLYCMASDGELTCLMAADGKKNWQRNLATEFGGSVGTDRQSWAYSESVLIDGDRVICTPGGKDAGLAALKKSTGETVWKAAVPDGGAAEYASIMIVPSPRKQYTQFLRKGVVGVDAATGKFLWSYGRTVDMGANILTPVVVNDRVFTAGSRSGGATIELKADGDGIDTRELYFEKTFAPSIGGAVLIDGHLYASTGQSLACVEFATGAIKWKERSVGAASICAADGRLYVRGHSSDVALVEPSADGYREKGRFKQPDRSKIPAWPHPVVANGRLYLRDQEILLCYDVQASKVARGN